MEKPTGVNEADSELFRQSVGTVKAIRNDKINLNHKTKLSAAQLNQSGKKPSVNSLAVKKHSQLNPVNSEDPLLFNRPGLQHKVLRKLRRGQFPVEKVLDLHGMTILIAKKALIHFLGDCLTAKYQCIKIIHGKGHGSKEKQPVLKNNLNSWLQQHNDVLAYCSARPNDGGTGAVYVLLKNTK